MLALTRFSIALLSLLLFIGFDGWLMTQGLPKSIAMAFVWAIGIGVCEVWERWK